MFYQLTNNLKSAGIRVRNFSHELNSPGKIDNQAIIKWNSLDHIAYNPQSKICDT